MLDLNFVCDNKDAVAENCKNRGIDLDLNRIVELRDQRSALIQKGDELRREQKEVSGQIPKAKDNDQRQTFIAKSLQSWQSGTISMN